MKPKSRVGLLGVGALLLLCLPSPASAAEIRVLCSNALRAVVDELVPQFERSTGHKVVSTFQPSTQLRKRIDSGEPFDLAVLTTALIDDEIKAGRIAQGSRVIIARSGTGLSTRTGSPTPDIRTVDAFTKALLAARSITYATQGASAAPFEALVARLGIASQISPRYVLRETAAQVGEAVASGAAEIGVAPISEILPVKGVMLIGPFPAEIQSYVEVSAGLSASAQHGIAAQQLMTFLTAPSNLAIIKAKGMER